jgi:hypothetical protein
MIALVFQCCGQKKMEFLPPQGLSIVALSSEDLYKMVETDGTTTLIEIRAKPWLL